MGTSGKNWGRPFIIRDSRTECKRERGPWGNGMPCLTTQRIYFLVTGSTRLLSIIGGRDE